MDFEEAMRQAAHKADEAVWAAMRKYASDRAGHEDDLTGVLLGRLDAALEGQIGGLEWSSSILKHRSGVSAEEKEIGADLVIYVSLDAYGIRYSKGVLVQAKRTERGQLLNAKEHAGLVEQCTKMLSVTPSSFVFNYAKSGMKCGSATRIEGARDRDLIGQCDWTSYRFFFELFRCFIGDRNITSADVKDLPVPSAIALKARAG